MPTLMVEPGRLIAADAGFLVTRANVIKKGYKEFVGVDAGMNDLPRPSIYGAYHHITVLGKSSGAGDRSSQCRRSIVREQRPVRARSVAAANRSRRHAGDPQRRRALLRHVAHLQWPYPLRGNPTHDPGRIPADPASRDDRRSIPHRRFQSLDIMDIALSRRLEQSSSYIFDEIDRKVAALRARACRSSISASVIRRARHPISFTKALTDGAGASKRPAIRVTSALAGTEKLVQRT